MAATLITAIVRAVPAIPRIKVEKGNEWGLVEYSQSSKWSTRNVKNCSILCWERTSLPIVASPVWGASSLASAYISFASMCGDECIVGFNSYHHTKQCAIDYMATATWSTNTSEHFIGMCYTRLSVSNSSYWRQVCLHNRQYSPRVIVAMSLSIPPNIVIMWLFSWYR